MLKKHILTINQIKKLPDRQMLVRGVFDIDEGGNYEYCKINEYIARTSGRNQK